MKTLRALCPLFALVYLSAHAGTISRTEKVTDLGAVYTVTWVAAPTGNPGDTGVTFSGRTSNGSRSARLIVQTSNATSPSPTASGVAVGATQIVPNSSGSYRSFYIYVTDGVATVWGPFGPYNLNSPDAFKVTLKLFNDRDYPVKYKLVQNGSVVGEITLGPRQGIIQQFTVPEGSDITVTSNVEGITQNDDGTWYEVPGAVTSVPVGNPVTPTNTGTGATPPITDIPPAPKLPSSNTSTPSAPTRPVWKSTPTNNDPANQTDLLTNTVFREGVEKITERLDGTAVNEVKFTDPNTLTPVMNNFNQPGQDPIAKGAAKLPTAPNFSSMASSSKVIIDFSIPTLTGGSIAVHKEVDFAAYPYSGPVAIFRGACLVVLTLLFFLLSFYTVRSSFAGK